MPQLVTELSVVHVSFSPNAFLATRPDNSQGVPVTGADALLTLYAESGGGMGTDLLAGDTYWIPECMREWLRRRGYSTRALEDMEPHVREWDSWMRAEGGFYDYRDTDGFGRVYQVHRRSIMPAMRVCREWGSLLLDEKTVVACESQECSDWLASLLSATGFWGRAQETVVRAFGLGTGAFAVWMDVGRRLVRVRHYDARMVVPLSWDAEGVRECAFVTRCFSRGLLRPGGTKSCVILWESVNRREKECVEPCRSLSSIPMQGAAVTLASAMWGASDGHQTCTPAIPFEQAI